MIHKVSPLTAQFTHKIVDFIVDELNDAKELRKKVNSGEIVCSVVSNLMFNLLVNLMHGAPREEIYDAACEIIEGIKTSFSIGLEYYDPNDTDMGREIQVNPDIN